MAPREAERDGGGGGTWSKCSCRKQPGSLGETARAKETSAETEETAEGRGQVLWGESGAGRRGRGRGGVPELHGVYVRRETPGLASFHRGVQ